MSAIVATTVNPAKLNERNAAFWRSLGDATERRLASPTLREAAARTVQFEQLRGIPIALQLSLEAALEAADRLVQDAGAEPEMLAGLAQKNMALKGGSAKKRDTLSERILAIVQRQPIITEAELLRKLKDEERCGVIYEIQDDEVSFYSRKGVLKTAPLSGLKDRLARARKIIRSR